MRARSAWGVAIVATLLLAGVVLTFRPRRGSALDPQRDARPAHTRADATPVAREGAPEERPGPPGPAPDPARLSAQAAAAAEAGAAAIAACREAERAAFPTLSGPVEYQVAVGADGRVLQARSRLGAPARALDACVGKALGAFPPPGRTVTTRVAIPFPP